MPSATNDETFEESPLLGSRQNSTGNNSQVFFAKISHIEKVDENINIDIKQ